LRLPDYRHWTWSFRRDERERYRGNRSPRVFGQYSTNYTDIWRTRLASSIAASCIGAAASMIQDLVFRNRRD
jgi:hypothetical protein